MSELIELQEPGDIVWTMVLGTLLAWRVLPDGTLVAVDPGEVLGRE